MEQSSLSCSLRNSFRVVGQSSRQINPDIEGSLLISRDKRGVKKGSEKEIGLISLLSWFIPIPQSPTPEELSCSCCYVVNQFTFHQSPLNMFPLWCPGSKYLECYPSHLIYVFSRRQIESSMSGTDLWRALTLFRSFINSHWKHFGLIYCRKKVER